jgi:predicted nucleic acid-binding protein
MASGRSLYPLCQFANIREVPPVVPSVVVVEALTGRSGQDANTNRLLKTCDIVPELSEGIARRAAQLRHSSKRGSAVDAVVVATAEPRGRVFTGDVKDLQALNAF